jgi:hypothetical protein
MFVTNAMALGCPLLPVDSVNCASTLKATPTDERRAALKELHGVRVFDRNLHSRMLLVPIHARLKLLQTCVTDAIPLSGD